MFWVVGANEGDILNLVCDVLAKVAGDACLELARQVSELFPREVVLLDIHDRRCRIDQLVGGDARHRRA